MRNIKDKRNNKMPHNSNLRKLTTSKNKKLNKINIDKITIKLTPKLSWAKNVETKLLN